MNIELEYRVRPVTRYIVTRYTNPSANEPNVAGSGKTETKGEFDSKETAEAVAYALCKQEHEAKGWQIDDPRIQYPETMEQIHQKQLQRVKWTERRKVWVNGEAYDHHPNATCNINYEPTC